MKFQETINSLRNFGTSKRLPQEEKLTLAKIDVITKRIRSLKDTHEQDEIIEQMMCYEQSGQIDIEARVFYYEPIFDRTQYL